MFVPLHDENTLKSISFQYVTILLILINVAVFILEQAGMTDAMIASFALVPGELWSPVASVGIGEQPSVVVDPDQSVPEAATLLTYMFFHASWLHLGGNMLFLWVFGDNVEDAMGHAKFLVFYLLCGVAAGLLHVFVTSTGVLPQGLTAGMGEIEEVPLAMSPLVGASGAVAGVIAAYLMLHPHVRVWVLALKFVPLRISAFFALGLWILMQVVMVMVPMSGPVAWWAHIGGLIAGAVLILFFRRPGVRLFSRELRQA